MAVKFSGSVLSKTLLATALSAAVATTAFARSLAPDTESNPVSPSVTTEQGSRGAGEHYRIGGGHKHHHAGKKHHGQQREMRRAAIVIPGLGGGSQKLVDDLKLNDEQKAKLKSIQDEQKASRQPDREAFKKYRELRNSQLESGNIDPKALLEEQKALYEQFQQRHADNDAKWLGLWDTFSDEQKATVVKYFKARSAKWEEHRKQFEERRAQVKAAETAKTDSAATKTEANDAAKSAETSKPADAPQAAEPAKQ